MLNEKIYKTMHSTGAFSIAMGVTAIAIGLVVGVGSIITGALLLKRKSEITF